MTVIVNLYGAPGAGKSTTRAGAFHRLKLYGVNCEEVTEYAKDLTWEGREYALSNQVYVFAKQLKRMDMLMGKVDVVITDSPLMLSAYYGSVDLPSSFFEMVEHFADHPFRMDYFIERVKPYNPVGRAQTEEQSDAIGNGLMHLLTDCGVYPTILKGDEQAAPRIAMDVLAYLQADDLHSNTHVVL
jgi:hypothetical protein